MRIVISEESLADIQDQQEREADAMNPSRLKRIDLFLSRIAVGLAHTEIDE